MSLTSDIKPWYIKTFPGMNTKLEELESQDKWVKRAQNVRFEKEPGAVVKRSEVTSFNGTSMGVGGVVGLYRLYSSNAQKWVSVHDESAYVGNDATGAMTSIRENLTEGKRTSFVTYSGLSICSNGYDDIYCYDGSTDNVTWELGSCKGVVGTGTGITATAITYQVTIDEDAYVCGAISNTLAATNKSIDLSHIPLGPIGTVDRKIYRKDSGTGGEYKLVTTISNNTATTFTDTVASGDLTDSLPVVTDDMPKGACLIVHRERLFITRDPSHPNRIYYSNPYLPHYIQQTTNLDYMDIFPDDGDEIMGIPILLGAMICIKKNSIRRIHVTSAVSGSDPETWYADDPISWIGSPAPWSIVQTPGGIIFLGWDHWYIFDGANTNSIIDEFDTDEILESSYADTVSFYNKGIMLAAYTDSASSSQAHDRTMRYNLKRSALSFDSWTSGTIFGPNCFASRSGDNEAGDVFYGDSKNGYIIRDQDTERTLSLTTKSACSVGSETNVFVGGTENVPYMEIGDAVTADHIPDNVCIFWDDVLTNPGSGWTEITTFDGRLLKIDANYAVTSGVGTHTHAITGTLTAITPARQMHGKTGTPGDEHLHSHSISATSSAVLTLPRHFPVRMFYKNNTTVEYLFPVGASILWDQSFAPSGWMNSTVVFDISGRYVKLDSATEDLFLAVSAAHTHTHSGTSTTMIGGHVASSMSTRSTGNNTARAHTHAYALDIHTAEMTDWELDYVSFNLIKKVSVEENTWDGNAYYAYCLYTGSGAPGHGWAVVSTYDGKYLKINPATISTGVAANGSHLHTISNGVSELATQWGGGDDYDASDQRHTHPFTAASVATTPSPLTVTFRLIRKIIGQMQNYNDAILTQYTSGTWTSPSAQINSSTLLRMYWNEELEGTDNILIYTRTGATQAACESASWSASLTNPNGSDMLSTANVWLQYKVVFSANDTRVTNPRIYFTNGFVAKYTYTAIKTVAEVSVNMVYEIGFRNFDDPMMDKIFSKIALWHKGSNGSFTIDWETENASGTFTISLASNPERWDSFFPSEAFGKEINFVISKNDLYDFKIKEVKGAYCSQPIII